MTAIFKDIFSISKWEKFEIINGAIKSVIINKFNISTPKTLLKKNKLFFKSIFGVGPINEEFIYSIFKWICVHNLFCKMPIRYLIKKIGLQTAAILMLKSI